MMRMSVSVISVYRIGYRYRLILLLNIGYRNNRLIWISVQHYLTPLSASDRNASSTVQAMVGSSYCFI